MLKRIILSIIVGIAVAVGVSLLGALCIEVNIERIGSTLKDWAGVIGLLAGLWYFFTQSE